MNKDFKYYIDEDENIYNVETKLEKIMLNTLASLQQRIDKAIEYIENFDSLCKQDEELLDILKGEDYE